MRDAGSGEVEKEGGSVRRECTGMGCERWETMAPEKSRAGRREYRGEDAYVCRANHARISDAVDNK